MSGIASGLTKVFQTVGSGIARVSQAVMGVGGTVFSAGAATGSVGAAAQAAGGSTLGNILTGAIKQAGVGALVGGAIGAVTGQGFGKGALIGGLGGAITGGLSAASTGAAGTNLLGIGSAETPTGLAPSGNTAATRVLSTGGPTVDASGTAGVGVASSGGGTLQYPGASSAAPITAAATGQTGGLGQFLKSQGGGQLLLGLGQGLSGYLKAKSDAEEKEKDREYLRQQQQRVTDSYHVDPSVLAGGGGAVDQTARPTPAQKYGGRPTWRFDPSLGRVVMVAA